MPRRRPAPRRRGGDSNPRDPSRFGGQNSGPNLADLFAGKKHLFGYTRRLRKSDSRHSKQKATELGRVRSLISPQSLLLGFCFLRARGQAVALSETLPASAIPALDETRRARTSIAISSETLRRSRRSRRRAARSHTPRRWRHCTAQRSLECRGRVVIRSAPAWL